MCSCKPSADAATSVNALNALDELADRLRLVMARLRVERSAMPAADGYSPLPWGQLTESEKNQWRDHARACQEVMS